MTFLPIKNKKKIKNYNYIQRWFYLVFNEFATVAFSIIINQINGGGGIKVLQRKRKLIPTQLE